MLQGRTHKPLEESSANSDVKRNTQGLTKLHTGTTSEGIIKLELIFLTFQRPSKPSQETSTTTMNTNHGTADGWDTV